jgi:type IX secretion system PorP/SprF family membrane protein
MLVLTGMSTLKAQQLPVYNNYTLNPFIYNPARAGDDPEGGRINLGFRRQWDQMPNSPTTGFVTWDSRIKESNTALGVTVYHDRVGKLIFNTGASVAYNYRIPFKKNKEHELCIGLQAGIISQKFDFTSASTSDPIAIDPALIGQNSRATNFDMTVGINYHWKGLNVGFAVPQILNSKARFRGNGSETTVSTFKYRNEYIAHVSYEARFGGKDKKTWMVMPVVFLKAIKGIPVGLDLSVLLGYKQYVLLGAGYRNGGGDGGFFKANAAGIHITAGSMIRERVGLYYTMEMPLKSVRSEFGYTHEITITCRLTRKAEKKEFDANKKKVEDELAKVNQKADDAAKKAQDADHKGDSALSGVDALNKRVDSLDKKVDDNNSNLSKEIDNVNQRIDNIVFKKFGSVYFEVDKFELTDEAKSSLDAFKTKLGEMKGNYFIYLAGNASVEGTTEYNQALSAKRCDAVKRYLEGVGIAQRVLLLPYGENSWATEKQNVETDRAKNRRVDIYLAGE